MTITKVTHQTDHIGVRKALVADDGTPILGEHNLTFLDELKNSLGPAYPLTSSPDGCRVVYRSPKSRMSAAFVWDQNNQTLYSLKPSSPFHQICAANDVTVLALGLLQQIQIWTYQGAIITTIQTPRGQDKIALSGDGSTLGVMNREAITLFNHKGEQVHSISINPSVCPTNFSLSFDGQMGVWCSKDQWSTWSRDPESDFNHLQERPCLNVQWAGDNIFFFLTGKEVMMFDKSGTNRCKLTLHEPESKLKEVIWALSSDGKRIAAFTLFSDSENPSLRVWDAHQKESILQAKTPMDLFQSLTLSPTGGYAVLTRKGETKDEPCYADVLKLDP
ncbi:MAG: hypothetical protein S4CHLAM45_10470 [Chlamydiales bacterium]|nr:hypothetical protein [Chlamydiales bacterium]MCH9619541.1 hypothetical protein [Chlamydiales bacterium]MCH9623147.1 hypothetical protein [Chlamydiales bacterium]